jgi:hypothetical protein
MDRAYSIHDRNKNCLKICLENVKGRHHLMDLGIAGKL